MSGCELFAALLGVWGLFVTVLYFKADNEATDLKGCLTRTQNEIDYIRNRHPQLWKKVASALEMRYLDELE